MSRASAIRTARTAVTGAQNAGRMDSYKAAEGMGIKLKKQWLSTLDNRTRHAHAMLDGQTVDTDKPFKVDGYKIMFPGDRSAPGYLVYNCRCTMSAALDDVDTSDAQRRARNPETGQNELVSDMSYQELAGWKEKEQKTVANVVKSGIIQGEDTKSIGFQFFANKSIPSRSDRELQKSIVSWQKNISVHLDKIEHPEKYDAEWLSKSQERQNGLIKHWRKEITNFQSNIDQANEELERRRNGR